MEEAGKNYQEEWKKLEKKRRKRVKEVEENHQKSIDKMKKVLYYIKRSDE